MFVHFKANKANLPPFEGRDFLVHPCSSPRGGTGSRTHPVAGVQSITHWNQRRRWGTQVIRRALRALLSGVETVAVDNWDAWEAQPVLEAVRVAPGCRRQPSLASDQRKEASGSGFPGSNRCPQTTCLNISVCRP